MILEKGSSYITSDNVALLSVIITRHAEMKYKKYDDKKVQYLKLIDLMQKTLYKPEKNERGEIVLSDDTKKMFLM